MRFKLSLRVLPEVAGRELPLNYQYELSSAIYKILSRSDVGYSSWLHENGYEGFGGKKFKLFSFSRLLIPRWEIPPGTDRIKILSDEVEWLISFLPENSTEKFIQGVFAHQRIGIGDRKSCVQFVVERVELLPMPAMTDCMEFETLSPMTLRCWHSDINAAEYISPSDKRAAQAVYTGLVGRYRAVCGKRYQESSVFGFEVLNEPKSALIKIKAGTLEQTFVRGYMCRFRIETPLSLMKILYESGVGELCSQGFGFVREIKR